MPAGVFSPVISEAFTVAPFQKPRWIRAGEEASQQPFHDDFETERTDLHAVFGGGLVDAVFE